MTRLIRAIQEVHNDERGHVEVGMPALVAAIGAILLGIGAATLAALRFGPRLASRARGRGEAVRPGILAPEGIRA